MIILQLPAVKKFKLERPKHCKYCTGEILQRWGKVQKKIKDTKIKSVEVYRYFCLTCNRSFRDYPDGTSQAQQSERLKKLTVVMWALGYEYRTVQKVLSIYGVTLSRMSGWRGVKAEGEKILKSAHWKQIVDTQIHEEYLDREVVGIYIDVGEGELLAVGYIDENDMAGIQNWLDDLKELHGIGVIVQTI